MRILKFVRYLVESTRSSLKNAHVYSLDMKTDNLFICGHKSQHVLVREIFDENLQIDGMITL